MLLATIILRFVQTLAMIAVAVGLSNGPAFFDVLGGLAQGQLWDQGEFARRMTAFTAPTVLGGLAIVGIEAMLRATRMLNARSLQFPDQPWMWNPDWAQRRIRRSNRTALIVSGVMLAIYGFVVLPIGLWMASIKLSTGIYVFLGVMAAILLAFVRMMWLSRRWSRSELRIFTLPGVIGGPFAGLVTLGESFPQGTPFRVTLKCLRNRTYRMRMSRESRSVTDTVWQDQKILTTSLAADRPGAISLPCHFAIPYHCEPTSRACIVSGGLSSVESAGRGEIVSFRWLLSVGMKDTLDPRQASFEIPVFKTSESSPTYTEDESIDRPFLEPVDADALLQTLPFRRETTATGERLHFLLYRASDCFFLSAFTLAMVMIVAVIFRYVETPARFFAALIPAALGLLGVRSIVEMLTWSADIEIGADTVAIVAGYAWSRHRHEFPRGKHVTLECHEDSRRETGNVYSVRLLPPQGPPCDLIKHVDGKQNAAALRDWLARQWEK